MSDSLKADKAAMDAIASGINGATGELKGIGTPGAASVGRGFSELSLSGMETGHEGLTSSFKEFCDRWEWGVRALLQDAGEFAERVGLAAGYYHEGDTYVSNTFKVVANAGMGNPHLTEDQVEHMSWGQVGADNPFTQVRDADYSAESLRRTGENAEQVWSKTAEDVEDSVRTGGATPLGMGIRTVSKIEDYG